MDRPGRRPHPLVRRGAARRALTAFVLLLTVPLRALAGVAMPCCPIEAPTHVAQPMPDMTHEGASPVAMTMHDAQDHAGHDGGNGSAGGHRSTASACCATVAIGAAAMAARMLPPGMHVLLERRIDPIAAFITDAPERPPRLHGLSA